MAIANIRQIYQATVTTTDATLTTILTVPMPTTAQVMTVLANCIGKTTTPGLTSFRISASWKNVGGTVSQVGATSVIHAHADSGLNTADVEFAVSGTNVLVQVQGVAATNMEWLAEAEALRN